MWIHPIPATCVTVADWNVQIDVHLYSDVHAGPVQRCLFWRRWLRYSSPYSSTHYGTWQQLVWGQDAPASVPRIEQGSIQDFFQVGKVKHIIEFRLISNFVSMKHAFGNVPVSYHKKAAWINHTGHYLETVPCECAVLLKGVLAHHSWPIDAGSLVSHGQNMKVWLSSPLGTKLSARTFRHSSASPRSTSAVWVLAGFQP